MEENSKINKLYEKINFLYKFDNSWHSITANINKDLQENNFLIKKNIYLIEIDQGIVWGYDENFYEVDQNYNVIKKKINEQALLKNKEEKY